MRELTRASHHANSERTVLSYPSSRIGQSVLLEAHDDRQVVALHERQRHFQVSLALSITIGPGGFDRHTRLFQVNDDDVHINLARG